MLPAPLGATTDASEDLAALSPLLFKLARLQLRNAQMESLDELYRQDGRRHEAPLDWGDPEAALSREQFFARLPRGDLAPETDRNMTRERIMIPCRRAHELISARLDHSLGLGERFRLGLHLSLCGACSRIARHMDLIRAAIRRMGSG